MNEPDDLRAWRESEGARLDHEITKVIRPWRERLEHSLLVIQHLEPRLSPGTTREQAIKGLVEGIQEAARRERELMANYEREYRERLAQHHQTQGRRSGRGR